jgi:ATP-dependent Clp protease ATP-binding subunit ClpC
MGNIYSEEEELFDYNQTKKSNTSVLDLFGTNISKLAAEGKIDPVVGREDELFRLIQILGRRKKNNPVLVGHPGVGKTSIVEGLALKILEGDVPFPLQGKIIFSLELGNIVAGTKYRGQFEERMKLIIDELTKNKEIIIFIDEIHTLVGAGNVSGSLDASNIIKPALANGTIRCIGATTFDEFRESIEGDGALDRRFQKIIVDPPTSEETLEIIKNISSKYESFHNVTYDESIHELIVKMADRYINDRFFPDKAIDILDEVGSYKSLVSSKVPLKIKKLEEKLKAKEADKLYAVSIQNYELAAKERDLSISIKKEIDKEFQKWKESRSKERVKIEQHDVLKVISKITELPLEKIDDNENKNLLGIKKYLKDNVIGQDDAIEKISIAIQRSRVGLRKINSTIGNFIFLGSSGIGKTKLAREISNYLFNSEDNLIRIDMSEYMEAHSVSKLIGSPPGYVGYEDGGHLTERVRQQPYSVVLFDEIEKAHPAIFNILLQILDDGYITDSLGTEISFRNCLIILTSNVGSRKVQDFGSGIGFKTSKTNIAEEEINTFNAELNKKFSPEFLNRIDEIIIFNKLSKDNLIKILTLECNELANMLREVGEYKLLVTKSAKELILDQGYNEKYGARHLNRSLTTLVTNPLTEMILRGEVEQGNTIKVQTADGKIKISIIKD